MTCLFPDCPNIAHSRGLCSMHYGRARRSEDWSYGLPCRRPGPEPVRQLTPAQMVMGPSQLARELNISRQGARGILIRRGLW